MPKPELKKDGHAIFERDVLVGNPFLLRLHANMEYRKGDLIENLAEYKILSICNKEIHRRLVASRVREFLCCKERISIHMKGEVVAKQDRMRR